MQADITGKRREAPFTSAKWQIAALQTLRPNPLPDMDLGSTGIIGPSEPNLPPIDEFAPRASTEGHMGASAH
jgi:hypothetical protein